MIAEIKEEIAEPVHDAELVEGDTDAPVWRLASPPLLHVPHPDVFKQFLSADVTTLASTIAYLKWLKESGEWMEGIRAKSLDVYAQTLVAPMGT